MGDARRHQNGRGRAKRDGGGLEGHLATALRQEQNLRQIAVAVGADHPVMQGGTRGDGFDVDKVECLIVR